LFSEAPPANRFLPASLSFKLGLSIFPDSSDGREVPMAGIWAARPKALSRIALRTCVSAFVGLSALTTRTGAAIASADDVIGEWRTPAGINIQVKTCGETVCARIVKLPEPALKDLNNPEPRLRTRPVLGIQIFVGERRVGMAGWKGHMYIPESGHTYVSRMMVLERTRLQVSVCGPMGFFCTREEWLRTR
jgi:uncharacterized protein (DUF2147 family)